MEGEECPVKAQQEVMEMEDPVEAQQEVMEMEEFTNLVVNSLAETNEIVNQKIEPAKEIEKEEQLQENYENENADEDLVSIQKEERAIKIKNEDGAEDEEESSGADSNGAEIFRCLGAEFGANNIQNLKWGVTKENRCCTDIPFLVAIVLFCLILGLTIVKPAVDAGHHKRIVASQDYLKNFCGYDDMINKEFGAWPKPSDFDFMHCIASCDETLTSFGYASTNVYNLCVPDDREIDFANYWKELSPQLMVADLLNYKDWYLKASACTFVVLLGWFLIVKYLLRYVIYLLPVLVAGGTAFGSYLLYQPYAENHDDKVSLYLCILCATCGTLLFCCLTCCMGHFMKVMDVIEMSISALFNFEMFFAPIISLVLSGTVLVLFLMLFALLYSSTGAYAKKPIGTNEGYANDDADFYHVFEIDFVIYEETVLIVLWFFWIMKFVDYVNFLIISGSVGEWYLMKSLRAEREEANTSFVESGCCGRLGGSVFRTIFYHLGTAAFASLTIAIIETIQFVIEVLKYSQSKFNMENPIASLVKSCLDCVLQCIKCLVAAFNSVGLVLTAVLGYPLCGGCTQVMDHDWVMNVEIATLQNLSVFVVTLASFAVMVIWEFGGIPDFDDLEPISIPLAISLLVCYFVTKLLISVWSVASITILVLYIMIERNFPDPDQKRAKFKSVGTAPVKEAIEMQNQEEQDAVDLIIQENFEEEGQNQENAI